MTSRRNLTSISDDVCPLIPRPAKLFFVKKSGSMRAQLSVMELLMNTTSGAEASLALASA